MKKFFTIFICLLIVGLGIFGYIRYFVPFSDDGVKIGQLNDIKRKGYIFKTYEGKLIQSGFWAGKSGMQSNTFEFSVDNPEVVNILKSVSQDQIIKLYYKEYYATLPWRGYSKYVVDSVSIENSNQSVPSTNSSTEHKFITN